MTSCQFNATLNGIGDFVVLSATAGHATPENSNVIHAKVYSYYSTSYDTSVPPNITAWEAGSGTYSILTHTLKRTNITANSDGTLIPVNFPLPPIVDVYASPSGTLEPIAPTPPRTYISGLTLSTAGSSTTFSVAAGQATDSTNIASITLASTMSKTTAAWAVGTGNGSFDGTGSAPSSTQAWYHVHLIKRVDTGVVDVLTSNSATAPTLPASYTLFRRIGPLLTTGSFQWTLFSQRNDEFMWNVARNDVAGYALPIAVTPIALSVPPGVITNAFGIIQIACTTPPYAVALYSPAAISGGYLAQTAVAGEIAGVMFNTRTDTTSRISMNSNVAANGSINMITHGFNDSRGKEF